MVAITARRAVPASYKSEVFVTPRSLRISSGSAIAASRTVEPEFLNRSSVPQSFPNNMTLEEDLYESVPDRLYYDRSYTTWYACYDNDMCVLTNSTGILESFCYSSKGEYRDVRRTIVEEYDLKQVKQIYDEDD